MAIQFVPGQVAVADLSPTGPSALSGPAKGLQVKVAKLSGANFTTGGANNLVMVLPADATIICFKLWVKTQLAGGGITAATFSVGSTSGGTQFVNASALAFGTANTFSTLPTVSGIYQNYNIPYGADIQLFVNGTATTGNPNAGELYLTVEYVR